MQRVAVGLRKYRDRTHAEFLASAIDAKRDLTAVGDQDLSKNANVPLVAAGLAAIQHEERLTVFDRRPVTGRNRDDPSAAQTVHRIANA